MAFVMGNVGTGVNILNAFLMLSVTIHRQIRSYRTNSPPTVILCQKAFSRTDNFKNMSSANRPCLKISHACPRFKFDLYLEKSSP